MVVNARSLSVVLVLLVSLSPLARLQTAQAFPSYHNSKFMAALRIVPAVAGTIAGFYFGSQFGVVGKVVGSIVGFEVGKFVGKFISRQVGDVVYDPYPFPGPYAPSTTGTGAPAAPQSSGDSLARLRDRWLSALRKYEQTIRSGPQADRLAARAVYEQARQAYEQARRSKIGQ